MKIMQKNFFFRTMTVIISLLLHFSLQATTVHVEIAGTLPSLIDANQKYEITDLTLSGNLNSQDILYIREMAGCDVDGYITNGKLTILNLADANIVSGGGYYYYNYSTSDNSIGNYMFFLTNLVSVVLPESLTIIDNQAFSNCMKLTNIILPESLISIEESAFLNCMALTSIDIPDNVVSIGEFAFYSCNELSMIFIGSGTTSIGDGAFSDCPSLKEFVVSKENIKYCSVDGVLFNKDKTTLLLYPNAKTNTSYSIPNTVIIIGYTAFSSCTKLTSITIPNNVTTIGDSAFADCAGLTSITIPESVIVIGYNPFSRCTELKEIIVSEKNTNYSSVDNVLFTKSKLELLAYPNAKSNTYSIPESVTSIGSGAFGGCRDLIDITIPESVTLIGNSAFNNCIGLISIAIPESVTSIGSNAFYGCEGLTSIVIPSKITSIEEGVFGYCKGLTNIIIPGNITSIGSFAFYGCEKLINIIIPDNVISIRNFSFSNCSELTSITIGNNVSSIGNNAFAFCPKLKEIYSKNPTPPSIIYSTFYNIDVTACKLYVPKDSYAAYSTTNLWREFLNIIEMDFTSIDTIAKENIAIQSIPNGIAINTKETTPISIFNVSGKKVYESIIDGNAEIHLNKGIYIVKTNSESQKIIVR